MAGGWQMIRVRDITSGHERDAQLDWRTIDVPTNIDLHQGWAVAMEHRPDCVAFGYVSVTGATFRYIMTASTTLEKRAVWSRFMLESEDTDDEGRALWWLTERIA
jgi:hypothetical protein